MVNRIAWFLGWLFLICACAPADPPAGAIWTEAESVFAGPPESRTGAGLQSGGGASANAYVSSGGASHSCLSYLIRLPQDMDNAMLSVRYSCPADYTYAKRGKSLKVWKTFLDGRQGFPLILPPTHEQEHKGEPVWAFASLPLGKLSRGEHRIVLRPRTRDWSGQMRMDGFYVHDGLARFADRVDAENRLPAPTPVPPLRQARTAPSADALAIADGDVFVGLNETGWRFCTDPNSEGEARHWHEPAFNDSDWKTVNLCKPWEAQGAPNYDGVGWYRRRIVVPKAWQEKDVRLYICQIAQYGWVYVNGRLAHVSWDPVPCGACHAPGGISGVGAKSISDALRFGEENVIAIKVWNPQGSGGISTTALLYATERMDGSMGMFHLLSPAPNEEYGVILGYYANARTWPSGYRTMVLGREGKFSWSATALGETPIPRHLMNRATPLCVAKKAEIERFLAGKPQALDLGEVSPHAMKASEPKILSIRGTYPESRGYLDVVLTPRSPFKRGQVGAPHLSLLGAGRVDETLVPSHLHGKQREQEFGQGVAFDVDYPADGEFSVYVERIALDACLEIRIDGQKAMAWELPSERQPGSVFDEKWKIWNCVYDKRFGAPVPQGRHTVSVHNTKDNSSWIQVKEYVFSRYAKDDFFGHAVGKIGQYETLELAVDVAADYVNPYDRRDISLCAYFSAPSGKVDRVWGFFNQDFAMAEDESLSPKKGPAWKVRYTPREVGEYTYFVQLDDGVGSLSSEKRGFLCEPSKQRGFIRISKSDPRYLESDGGAPFYLLGISGWPPSTLAEFEKQYQIQCQNSENYCFFATFQSGEIRTRPMEYSQMPFWRMDRIFSLAEKYGITIQVFHDEIQRGALEDKAFDEANGGPCQTREMVYTNGTAREMSRNLVQYLVARYAHSPSFLLWGFGDEVSWSVEPLKRKWIREMVDEFKIADPYGHITIIGEGEKWLPEGGDMVDTGGWYVHLNKPETKVGVDIAEFMEKQIAPLRGVRKAIWQSEGGLCEIGPVLGTSDDYMALGKEMIHLHNQIWSSFMVGYCGSGTEWVRTLVNEYEQHYHYKAFAEYLRGEPFPSLGLEAIKPQASSERLRALGMKGKGTVYLWVQNRQHTWYKQLVEKSGLEEIRDAKVILDGMENGPWTLEWWDTYAGRIAQTQDVTASEGRMEIAVPPVLKDVACKLRRK